MNSENQSLIDTMLKSFQYLITESIKDTTKIYDGRLSANNGNGTWNVRYNGEVHAMKPYGSIVPQVGMMVKVFIPQGNQNLAFFM